MTLTSYSHKHLRKALCLHRVLHWFHWSGMPALRHNNDVYIIDVQNSYVYIILFYKPWHLWSHTGERPLIYHWLLCNKWFTRSDDLNVVFSHILEKSTLSAQIGSTGQVCGLIPTRWHCFMEEVHPQGTTMVCTSLTYKPWFRHASKYRIFGGSLSARYNIDIIDLQVQAMVYW